ncbi:GTPase IMAP family member 7 [Biomphalaria pfeifferi]|uniref:GTPase IMAP family member 7 n=1 Tax=Biomphalaria pfeifferi TaxID=112525 RepID=A0AAD8B8R8_BIOPF|nr:GTPase IMAP family member 7 [Biomphalaria pfeifferi]
MDLQKLKDDFLMFKEVWKSKKKITLDIFYNETNFSELLVNDQCLRVTPSYKTTSGTTIFSFRGLIQKPEQENLKIGLECFRLSEEQINFHVRWEFFVYNDNTDQFSLVRLLEMDVDSYNVVSQFTFPLLNIDHLVNKNVALFKWSVTILPGSSSQAKAQYGVCDEYLYHEENIEKALDEMWITLNSAKPNEIKNIQETILDCKAQQSKNADRIEAIERIVFEISQKLCGILNKKMELPQTYIFRNLTRQSHDSLTTDKSSQSCFYSEEIMSLEKEEKYPYSIDSGSPKLLPIAPTFHGDGVSSQCDYHSKCTVFEVMHNVCTEEENLVQCSVALPDRSLSTSAVKEDLKANTFLLLIWQTVALSKKAPNPPPLPAKRKPKEQPMTSLFASHVDNPSNDLILRMQQQMFDFYSSFSKTKKISSNSDLSVRNPDQEIDLLLLGKTGNGKSALGNSILRRNVFESKSSMASVTVDVTYDEDECNGVKIKVVDGPGVGDTRLDKEEAVKDILEKIAKTISINSKGYHAFLLVLKYGTRMTGEEQEAIQLLRTIFGDLFFGKFCIIVMTYGDLFDHASSSTFEKWVADQDCGIFRELLKQCDNRIVLFDNRTTDESKKQTQLKKLITMIHTLKKDNCRYADEHFQSAQTAREVILLKAEKDLISEDVMSEANMIFLKFQQIINTVEPALCAESLRELSDRANALISKIKEKDKSLGVLHELVSHVVSLDTTINDEIKLSAKLEEERARLRQVIEDEALSHALVLKMEQEEFMTGRARDEEHAKILEHRLAEMKEKEETWRKEVQKLEESLKAQWILGHRDLQALGNEIQNLKAAQVKKMSTKIKGGIIAKLRSKLLKSNEKGTIK